ncbi:MAG: Uma2 family endonuclease [Dehalococcoidia bacterium]
MSTLEAPPKRWTVAEMLELPDWEDYELVDGNLRTRSQEMDAAETTAELIGELRSYNRRTRAGRLLSETQQYRVFHDPERVSKADISFFRKSRAPKGNVGICDVAPDLVVEVASPSNGILEVWDKVERWLSAGVALVWVALPEPRQIIVFTRGVGPKVLLETDEIDGGDVLPGFRSVVSDMFPPRDAN